MSWYEYNGTTKTQITSSTNTDNQYLSGSKKETLTTKVNVPSNTSSKRYEAVGTWTDPIKLSTDNGVVFKNQEGETVVTTKLYKGGQPFVGGVVWSWTLDGVTTLATFTALRLQKAVSPSDLAVNKSCIET